MPNVPEWFSGSRLNYGENLLQGNDDDIAIYAAGFIHLMFISIKVFYMLTQ